MLLTEAQAKKVFAGSFESKISALACASAERGWTLVSTNESHVHVIDEGRLIKRSYTETGDGYDFGRAVAVNTLPESDAVGIVANRIKGLASSIFEGEGSINHDDLILMSRHARGYMNESEAIKSLANEEMDAYYEASKTEIRRGVHGRLGDIESDHRLTYYRRMSATRAEENRAEIIDSLRACAERLDALECHGDGEIPMILAKFKEQGTRASAIIRHSGLPISQVAEAADLFSKSLQTASILREYHTQTEGK